MGAHADSAPCTVQRVGRAAAGRAPCLAWSRRAPWLLEHMWCNGHNCRKEGRCGVRERAAGGGSEADERPERVRAPGSTFMGSDGAGRPSERPRQGGRKALAQGGLMLDICGGASQHSTADGTREVIATSRPIGSARFGLSENEPFQGGTGRLLEFALQGPQISKFLRQNPLLLETPNTEVVFRAAHGVRPELPRKLRADRAPGRRFRARRQKQPPDLRPPLLGHSIALLFFIRPFDRDRLY